jgi:hypothetical protein
MKWLFIKLPLAMVHGWPYQGFQKIPHLLILIIFIENFMFMGEDQRSSNTLICYNTPTPVITRITPIIRIWRCFNIVLWMTFINNCIHSCRVCFGLAKLTQCLPLKCYHEFFNTISYVHILKLKLGTKSKVKMKTLHRKNQSKPKLVFLTLISPYRCFIPSFGVALFEILHWCS